MSVTFLPKAGKPSKENTTIEADCKAQHAYLRGKSDESAIHEVIRVIEESLEKTEFTLG